MVHTPGGTARPLRNRTLLAVATKPMAAGNGTVRCDDLSHLEGDIWLQYPYANWVGFITHGTFHNPWNTLELPTYLLAIILKVSELFLNDEHVEKHGVSDMCLH